MLSSRICARLRALINHPQGMHWWRRQGSIQKLILWKWKEESDTERAVVRQRWNTQIVTTQLRSRKMSSSSHMQQGSQVWTKLIWRRCSKSELA